MPWNPPHVFQSIAEHLDYYRGMFLDICGPEYVEKLFNYFSTDAQVHLTHGDFLPRDILVDGFKVTVIIGWETADYYPELWEYYQMHDPGSMTPTWGHVPARTFPGARREREIDAVSQIVLYIKHNRVV